MFELGKGKRQQKVLKRIGCPKAGGVLYLVTNLSGEETVTESTLIDMINTGRIENATIVNSGRKISVRLLDRTHKAVVRGEWDNGPFMIVGQIYEATEGRFWSNLAEQVNKSHGVRVGAAGKRYIDLCSRCVDTKTTLLKEMFYCGVSIVHLPQEIVGAIRSHVLSRILSEKTLITSVDLGESVSPDGLRNIWVTTDYYHFKDDMKRIIWEKTPAKSSFVRNS